MSHLSEKELKLMTAVMSNIDGSLNSLVNWNQTALDAGYQDGKNAKVMWTRLAKKLADTAAGGARAADGANEHAGKGSAATPTKASKKRKTAGTPIDGSPVKATRATKKAKGSGDQADQLNAEDKSAATDVNIKGHSSEAEVVIGQQAKEEDT